MDVFRVSEAASLGLHAMVYLAGHPGEKTTTALIAAKLRVSAHHLAKVMQRLVRAGLIASQRGAGGGFRLADQPRGITLLAIYEAVEGPLRPRACLLGAKPICPPGKCIFGSLNTAVHKQVKDHLRKTTLASVSAVFADK
jgi:Rrf2 family protein